MSPSDSGALFDSTQQYRYRLWRSWSSDPTIGFVMLNPNQADAVSDDPTIRRCIGFAKNWGFGGIEVVNLSTTGYRSSSISFSFIAIKIIKFINPYNIKLSTLKPRFSSKLH
ncbi:MAG: DUF1643 domain-containing protein [Leptolyngbya sp. Prado105]|jgi:hypothetical protein|nr:DUF1643 domain-containing protein [Leptolyngbya sp. Prado105]